MAIPSASDLEVQAVVQALLALDPKGLRVAQVLRNTLDQLYDGQRTGRYRWDQLFKTEKTHCGTLVEINLQREFEFQDGLKLDYRIAGVEVDCKYSQTVGGWMIPPEAQDGVCLLASATDGAAPTWNMGIVRMLAGYLNTGGNRDRKLTLNAAGRSAITWLFKNAPLPPNALLQLDRQTVDGFMAISSGQKRINELFRKAIRMRVSRAVVATVAQQDDYMKRVRANGGARTALRPEGIVILGQYQSHAEIARALGVPVPVHGESVSVQIVPAKSRSPGSVEIGGTWWRIAKPSDPVVPAPELPCI